MNERLAQVYRYLRFPFASSVKLLLTVRLFSALVVVVFLVFSLHDGLPLLRHDWGLPSFPEGWRSFGVSMLSGWDPVGIGEPRPYPTWFIVGPVLAIVGSIAGSACALLLLMLAIAVTAVCGGVRLGKFVCRSEWTGLMLAAAFLFSPWTYEKLVAGHLTMLLSAAVCLYLASELLAARPRLWVVALCGYIAAFQIQYAVLVVPFALLLRFEWSTTLAAAAGSILGSLPSIVGIALARSYLMSIPYSVPWQLNNSIAIGEGALLDGYAPHYTGDASLPLRIGVALLLVAAAMGLPSAIRKNFWRTIRLAGAAIALIFYAGGLRSPIPQIYEASLAIRPTLVFRELYDLLGVVLVLYLVLAAAGAKSKAAAVLCSTAAAVMLLSWCAVPPWRWWVPSAAVPHVSVKTNEPNTRFALLPWRQPLQFHGEGSGPDPDLFARANGVTPVNQYQYDFPAGAALAAYAGSGDTRGLEALSVAEIYNRPYFSSDVESIREAFPSEHGLRSRIITTSQALRAQPELEFIETPPAVDVLRPFYQLYLFDGGDPESVAADVDPVAGNLNVLDPRLGWAQIQADPLAFSTVENAFGGAVTTNPSAVLHVPAWHPTAALAKINGSLASKSQVLARSTHGWKWIPLHGAASLECRGTCAISLWKRRAFVSAFTRVEHQSGMHTAVAFTQIAPFLIAGTAPAQSARGDVMLLFRTRYDASWKLFGLPVSRHLIISTIFNGYQISQPFAASRFILVEMTALFQFISMLGSVVGIAVTLLLLKNGDSRAERLGAAP